MAETAYISQCLALLIEPSPHIVKFATNFNNLNAIEKGCSLSELDLEHLKKAVEITKNTAD